MRARNPGIESYFEVLIIQFQNSQVATLKLLFQSYVWDKLLRWAGGGPFAKLTLKFAIAVISLFIWVLYTGMFNIYREKSIQEDEMPLRKSYTEQFYRVSIALICYVDLLSENMM